jgi:hypothetical protein
MTHKCFISYKTHDQDYKDTIQTDLKIDMIDKSLNEPIDSEDEDYIMRVIRRDHLQDSTVTIVLIGQLSAENSLLVDQRYIKRELQASLYDSPNGILGVVLPSMTDRIYKGLQPCLKCGGEHNVVNIDNSTTIREFNYNYYLPLPDDEHVWSEDERYCVLVKWEDFEEDPEKYIDQAYEKRTSDIAQKIKVYPK